MKKKIIAKIKKKAKSKKENENGVSVMNNEKK